MCSIPARKSLGRVIVSTSRCIYENLALEESLMRTHRPEDQGEVMLVWSNGPAVVVGRHQNPWMEVNLPLIEQRGIDLVRRHSGGGTVYHDEGNINVSLLTTQKVHCRKRNLEWIANAINKKFNVQVVPTPRDDMEMQPGSRKCSGTAARIARGRAYHHLTMLINVDLSILSGVLRSPIETTIHSTATRSTRAPAVGFLAQDDGSVTVEGVRETLIQEFERQFVKCDLLTVDAGDKIKEDEAARSALQELHDWEWRFGKTPKFEVNTRQGRIVVEKGRISSGGKDEWRGRPFSLDLTL